MPALRKAVGYVRISDTNGRHGENFISPESQQDRIRKLAAARGFRVVRFERDDDMTGGTNHRPGLQAAIEACETREVDALLTAYHSRFARSSKGTYESLARLDEVAAEYHADDLPAPGTEGYKIMLAVVAANAEVELDRIRANWLDARSRAVARGTYIANRAPLGYRFGDGKRLVPDEIEAPAVCELFRGRAAGMTWKALAEMFERMTGRAIAEGSLPNIIRNRCYRGELRSGALVNLDAHPAIVTEDEWKLAQGKRTQRGPRAQTSEALLGAATLRCGSCGRTMSYRGGAEGQYVCNRQAKGEPCGAPVVIHASKLDPYVEAALLARIAEAEVEAEGAVEGDDLAAAERLLAEAIAERDAYLAADLASIVGVDAFRANAVERQARVDAAEAVVDELRGSADLDDRLATVGDEWPGLDREEQRRIAAAALDTVTIHRASRGRWTPLDERVEIAFAGATYAEDRVAA